MTLDEQGEIARWRPHHIFCERFLGFELPDRGEEFVRVSHMLRQMMESDSDAVIEVIRGIDNLCLACPDCRNDRCENPYGNEDDVRKWDAIILKGLGMSYGEKRTTQELRALIAHKAPLDFCRARCPWREICNVFK
jgi:hypothetical protein